MPSRIRPRFALAIALSMGPIAALFGCEAVVDGELGTVACSQQGEVGPPACPAGLACQQGVCAEPVWGAPCAVDGDCLPSEFCLDPVDFGGQGAPRCSRVCCSSDDCAPDATSVCWPAPAGGASFCMAAAEVERSTPGAAAALAPCDAGTACRSGLCQDGLCADTCCDDTSCAPGVCRLDAAAASGAAGGGAGGGASFWCSASVQGAPLYSACATDADCVSGLCTSFGLAYLVCSMPCCSSEECPEAAGVAARCALIEGPSGAVRGCMADASAGVAAVGEPCTEGSDCRSGLCIPTNGARVCSDLCCSDDACGEGASTEVCRPGDVDGAWALRCEPN